MAGVKDRLAELQANQQFLKDSDKKSKTKNKKSNVAGDMEGLQKQVRDVEARLTTLKRNVKEMETLQRNILSSPFCDKKEVQRYEQIVGHVQQVSNEVRGLLRNMEESSHKDSDSALNRIQTQQLNRLTNDLASTTNDFFKGQADYMDKIKKRMRTQLDVTKGTSNLSEEEMNEILQKDNYSAFTQDFISETQDAESQLRQIEDRQKEILALEKNVFEVNQLFKDMSLLVNDQGEKIDSIEANMTSAAANVESGTGKLKQARKHQSKARRIKIGLIVLAVVVVVIVVVVLVSVL